MEIEIRALGPGDDAAVVAASHLFDGPADPAATRRFLEDAGHHLLVAYGDSRPVGFVSGVEVVQPDKGAELLLYELGVDEPARRQGIGRRLVEAFDALARERGCTGMWVLVDDDNQAALATYAAAGAREASSPRLLEWTFGDGGR